MKFFVALSTFLVMAAAKPQFFAPLVRTNLLPLTATIPSQQQYHAQDEFGQYSYGYSDALSAKQEIKSLDGVIRGSYSYRDAENKLQTVDYVADGAGFRVAATNLPKPVTAIEPLPLNETPEVAAARDAHLRAHDEAKLRLAQPLEAEPIRGDLPRPVEDTPEVALAKAEHLRAIEDARLRNDAARYAYTPYIYPAQTILRADGLPFQFERPLYTRFLTQSIVA